MSVQVTADDYVTAFERSSQRILVEDYEGYTCSSIGEAYQYRTKESARDHGGCNSDSFAFEFTLVFAPEENATPNTYWLSGTYMDRDEKRQWRLTALAFAIAMAETGDL